MKKIFSLADSVQLHALALYLRNEGLDVLVCGDERTSIAGGIPPVESWPEIVLIDDTREAEAVALIGKFFEAQKFPPQKTWICPSCGEPIDGQFSDCWKCQPALPAGDLPPRSPLKIPFYCLLLVQIISSLILPYFARHTFSEAPLEVQKYLRSANETSSTAPGGAVLFVSLCVVEWVGMFFFLNFSRYLCAILWVWMLLHLLILPGVTLVSSLQYFLHILSCLSGGAILALVFFSPLKEFFERGSISNIFSRPGDPSSSEGP